MDKRKRSSTSVSPKSKVDEEKVIHRCIVCAEYFIQKKPSLLRQVKPHDPERHKKQIVDQFHIFFGLQDCLGIPTTNVKILFDKLLETYGGPGFWAVSFCPKHDEMVKQLKEVRDTAEELGGIKKQLTKDLKELVTTNLKNTDPIQECNDSIKGFKEIRLALRKMFIPSASDKKKRKTNKVVRLEELITNSTPADNEDVKIENDELISLKEEDILPENVTPDSTTHFGYRNTRFGERFSEIDDSPSGIIKWTVPAVNVDNHSISNSYTSVFHNNPPVSSSTTLTLEEILSWKPMPVRGKSTKGPSARGKTKYDTTRSTSVTPRKTSSKSNERVSAQQRTDTTIRQKPDSTRQKDFSCRKGCNVRFWSTVDQERHYASVHGETQKGSVCDECGKKFLIHDCLRKHKISEHPTIFKFRCGICGEGCRFLSSLNSHMQTHNTPKQKTVKNTRMFTSNQSKGKLDDPFKCYSCLDEFDSRTELNRHKRQAYCSNFAYL